MKNLVIVESPAKAKTITKYLGKDYVVKASMGHVVDLPGKELGVEVENNFKPTYKVSKEKQKVVTELKKLAKDAEKVWLATDEDREGEAIAWHIFNALKLKNNDYDRIVFHEITHDAITKAIKTPRKINQSLVDAQQARRIIDRLVGYKLSPMLWKKVRKGLSAGRVQSVAVRFVVEREEEIRAFNPDEFWDLKGEAANEKKKFGISLIKVDGKKIKPTKQEDVEKIIEKAFGKLEFKSKKDKKDYLQLTFVLPAGTQLHVKDIKVKTSKRSPAAPFITSTLQQEAYRRFGLAVGQTMRLAQQLYEGIDLKDGRVGLITYMRTDSTNLAKESLEQIKNFVEAKYGAEYGLKDFRTYKTKAKGAQEAHEAIRPVDIRVTPESIKDQLSPQLLKLYSLIWKRTVATQMQEAIFENTEVILQIPDKSNIDFMANGKVIKFEGFMKLYIEGTDDEEEEDEPMLPRLEKGELVDLKAFEAFQKFTKPPARYTEASLVKKLESEGIGRPSTYAPTISTIVTRGYIEKDKKHLVPTELAFIVNKFLMEFFKDIIDYKFTANIEANFDEVAAGEKEWKIIVSTFYGPFEKQLEFTAKNAKKYIEETEEECPECGKKLVIRMSKYGKFFSCSNYPECKYTRNIDGQKQNVEVEESDEICPECKNKMVYRQGRYGKFLACSNYPECKYIKKTPAVVVKEKGCPKCGGDIIEKRTRRGKIFFGCNKYPKCDFAVWKKEDLEKDLKE